MTANSETSANHEPVSRTFLFTNANGLVIFTDETFINRFSDSSTNPIIGKPLQDILKLDSLSASELLELVRQRNHLEALEFPINQLAGDLLKSTCTAVAARDVGGHFIGMDLVFKTIPTTEVQDQNFQFLAHTDIMQNYVGMVLDIGNRMKSRTYIQSYLAVQMDAIQILLARIAGPASRQAMEQIANDSAISNALPISLKNGHMKFTQMDINIQGYKSLMKTALNYAVDVLGKNLVKREMLMIDGFVGTGTLELITQMDLRVFFED